MAWYRSSVSDSATNGVVLEKVSDTQIIPANGEGDFFIFPLEPKINVDTQHFDNIQFYLVDQNTKTVIGADKVEIKIYNTTNGNNQNGFFFMVTNKTSTEYYARLNVLFIK